MAPPEVEVNTLKNLGLIFLAFEAFVLLRITSEFSQEIVGQTDQIILQAVILLLSVAYLQWLLTYILLPWGKPVPPWGREALAKAKTAYRRSSWRSIRQFGYCMLVLHTFGLLSGAAQHAIDLDRLPNLVFPATALIALGTLGWVRLVIHAVAKRIEESCEFTSGEIVTLLNAKESAVPMKNTRLDSNPS